MAVSYPASWIERVEEADKLVLDPQTGLFVSPDGAQRVGAAVVAERTESYLKAESARRKRRLTKDDERVCRAFVLVAANWRTGAWDRTTEDSSLPATRSRGRKSRLAHTPSEKAQPTGAAPHENTP